MREICFYAKMGVILHRNINQVRAMCILNNILSFAANGFSVWRKAYSKSIRL